MVSPKRAARLLFTRKRRSLHSTLSGGQRSSGSPHPWYADGPILLSMAPVSRTLADFLARTTWSDLPRSGDRRHAALDPRLARLGAWRARSSRRRAWRSRSSRGLGASRRSDGVLRPARIGRRRGARQRRGVAHPRARRHPQGLDDARRRAGDSRRARRRRARARRRARVPPRGRARLRGRAAHRRSGESEPLPLLASDRNRRDVRRRGGRRLAARPRRRRRCSTRSAAPGTQAAGLWEFNADGAMSKHLHPGKAAFNGVLVGRSRARRLHRRDAHSRGRSRLLSRDEQRPTTQRASPTDSASSGRSARTATRCWSCCGHTHSAIDVARRICDASAAGTAMRVDDLRAIHIETYGPGFEIVKEMNPGTPYQAKFSIAYCVAAALLEGGAALDAVLASDHFANGASRDRGHRRAARRRRRVTRRRRSHREVSRRRGRRA